MKQSQRGGHYTPLLVALLLCCCVAFTLSAPTLHKTKIAGLEAQALPSNTKPFNNVDIRINYQPHSRAAKNPDDPDADFFAQSFTSLSSTSTLDISTLSDIPPTDVDDNTFIPFGRHVRLAFSVDKDVNDVSFTESNTDDYLFVLRVDETTVSVDPAHGTSIQYITDDGEQQKKYSKRVTYSGEQLNADGTIDKAFFTLLPNSGDWDVLYRSNDSLETQSVVDGNTINDTRPMRPESLSTLSGRHENGYTMEGMILKANGKMIQITSYSSLLLQQYSLKQALSRQMDDIIADQTTNGNDAMTQQAGMQVQSKMIELDDLMETLYDQQSSAAYDLSFSEVAVSDFHCGGGLHAEKDEQQEEEEIIHQDIEQVFSPNNSQAGSPLNMLSQWTLNTWTSCHPNSGKKAVIFPVRYVLATNFQKWASNQEFTSSSAIVQGLVDARVQFAMTIMNYIYSQQLSVSLSIHSLRYLSSAELTTTINPQSVGCDVSSIMALYSNYAYDNMSTEVTDKGAINHLLLHCNDLAPNDSSTTGGTAGVAWMGLLCSGAFTATVNNVPNTKVFQGGVSAFTFNQVTSWGTLAHEIGHNFNADVCLPSIY